MSRYTIAAVCAVFAMVLIAAGLYWYHQKQEIEREIEMLMASAMLYNVRNSLRSKEFVEFHWRPHGRIVACGLSFTAISGPDSSIIESVTPGRVPDLCSNQDDIVYVSNWCDVHSADAPSGVS